MSAVKMQHKKYVDPVLEKFCGPFLSREAQDKGVTVDVTAWGRRLALCQATAIGREKATGVPKTLYSKERVVCCCCTKVKLYFLGGSVFMIAI
jgi:hypothetical protein